MPGQAATTYVRRAVIGIRGSGMGWSRCCSSLGASSGHTSGVVSVGVCAVDGRVGVDLLDGENQDELDAAADRYRGRGTRGRTGTAWQSVIVDAECPTQRRLSIRTFVQFDQPCGQAGFPLPSMIDDPRSFVAQCSDVRGAGSPGLSDCAHRRETALAGDPLPPPPASSHIPGGRLLRTDHPSDERQRAVPTTLHDPTIERDACGIGLVADARGRASRELVDRALAGLAAVSHRGAWAADGVTGDGAGLLLPLHECLTGERGAGVAMCFLREPWLRGTVEEACRTEGLEPLGWRDVPLDVAALGSTATASMPRIAQLVLAPCPAPDAELRAYRARRRAEPGRRLRGVALVPHGHVQGALRRDAASGFYPDLADPGWAAPWAIFHQRFSTNTAPSWERAQPFRLLGHNGEINTIDGNVEWMEARERARGSTSISRRRSIAPGRTRRSSTTRSSCSRSASTSARRSACSSRRPGRTTRACLTSSARCTGTTRCSPSPGTARQAWSSPTASSAGAALDRNGLRPLRIAVCDDGLVAVSSEAGAVPLPDGAIVRRGRLGARTAPVGRPGARAALRRRAEA